MSTLNDTDDAMIWAEEFVRIFDGKIIESGNEAPGFIEEGTMVGWFANAMQVAITKWLERHAITAQQSIDGTITLDEDAPDQVVVYTALLQKMIEHFNQSIRSTVSDSQKQAFVDGFEESRSE